MSNALDTNNKILFRWDYVLKTLACVCESLRIGVHSSMSGGVAQKGNGSGRRSVRYCTNHLGSVEICLLRGFSC